MKRRYAVAISAMIMALPFSNSASAAEPSLDQLEVIQEMLEENDVEMLRQYIAERPELLDGYTALSQLLLQFMAESINMISYLGLGQTGEEEGQNIADSPAIVSLY